MEHSMFVSLVLVLMLLGLVAIIFAIIKLIKIADELANIKEEINGIKNLGREKHRLFFKARLHGKIIEQSNPKAQENFMEDKKNSFNNSQESVENKAQQFDINEPPPKPGPKFDIEVSGEIDTSQDSQPLDK